MLKGTTKSGFRYEITTERLNNFELVEILSEVDENPLLLPKMLNLLLGEHQSKNLKTIFEMKKVLFQLTKSEKRLKIFLQLKIK